MNTNAPTIISVKNIWLAAVSLQEDQLVEVAEWPESTESSFLFLEPLTLDLQITKLKDALNLFVRPWSMWVQETCSLCGEAMELELEGGDAEYLFRPKLIAGLDEEYYLFSLKNFILDLQPIVEQECLLAKPLFPCCDACEAHKKGDSVLHVRVDETGIHKDYAFEEQEEEATEKPLAALKDLLKKEEKKS